MMKIYHSYPWGLSRGELEGEYSEARANRLPCPDQSRLVSNDLVPRQSAW